MADEDIVKENVRGGSRSEGVDTAVNFNMETLVKMMMQMQTDINARLDAKEAKEASEKEAKEVRRMEKEVKEEMREVARENRMRVKFDEINHNFDEVNRKFDEINHNFDGVNRKFDEINHNFDGVNRKFDEINHNLNERHDVLTEQILEVRIGVEDIRAKCLQNEAQIDLINNVLTERCNEVVTQLAIEKVKITENTGRIETVSQQIEIVRTELEENVASLQQQIQVKDSAIQKEVEEINNKVKAMQRIGIDKDKESTLTANGKPSSSFNVQNRNELKNYNYEQTSNSSIFTLADVIAPKFSNDQKDNPLQFIKDLENFCRLRNIPEGSMMYVTRQCLTGSCTDWFDLYIGKNDSYEVFKEKFIEYYWGSARQAEVMSQILTGRYDQNRRLTMSEYFLLMGRKARHLTPEIPTRDFISMMANHFPNEVRVALVISRIDNIPEALKLLKEIQVGRSVNGYPQHGSKQDSNDRYQKGENGNFWKKEAQWQHKDKSYMGDKGYRKNPEEVRREDGRNMDEKNVDKNKERNHWITDRNNDGRVYNSRNDARINMMKYGREDDGTRRFYPRFGNWRSGYRRGSWSHRTYGRYRPYGTEDGEETIPRVVEFEDNRENERTYVSDGNLERENGGVLDQNK